METQVRSLPLRTYEVPVTSHTIHSRFLLVSGAIQKDKMWPTKLWHVFLSVSCFYFILLERDLLGLFRSAFIFIISLYSINKRENTSEINWLRYSSNSFAKSNHSLLNLELYACVFHTTSSSVSLSVDYAILLKTICKRNQTLLVLVY